MRYILSAPNRQVLEQFAWSEVLLAFDFDGTLAPVVASPDRAALRPSTRRLLKAATALYPCVVISGRATTDVLRRLVGTGVHEVIGNHGAEPRNATEKVGREVGGWAARLEAQLGGLRGVKIENKGFSVAIHYRQSRQKKTARAAILDAANTLRGVRVIGGKQVVNVVPKDAPHKGTALERERARLRCDTAIYVGDDETDEDVFALDQPGRLLAIRVGPNRRSAADYFVKDQRDIDDLLRALVVLRDGVAASPLRRRGC